MSSYSSHRFLGVEIEFPFEPYNIQKCMMSQIINRLTNKEHGLIESPTGTGKTLVLLCAALAWQKKSKIDQQPFLSQRMKRQLASERLERLKKRPCTCDSRKPESCYDECDDDLKKKKSELTTKELGLDDKPFSCPTCLAIKAEEQFTEILITDDDSQNEFISSKIRGRIPRIYYGTRTHKQITQVIRELNKTPYKKELRICVLSSRDRTCINPEVRDLASRNDKCKEMLQAKNSSNKNPSVETCPYYSDSNSIGTIYETINDLYRDNVWDIEDAAQFGRDNRACTYFGVRSLQTEADITFCPYNYLLDPNIRNSLDINLKDAIVIFDEAHNIEDICRDSASFVIDTQQIADLIESIGLTMHNYQQGSATHDAYQFFRDKFINLRNYLMRFEFTDSSQDRDYLARHIMTQSEMNGQLQLLGFDHEGMLLVKEHLKKLIGDDDDDGNSSKKDDSVPGLNSMQLQFMTQLSLTLSFMYGGESKHLNDFRTVITKHLIREEFSGNVNWKKRNNLNKSITTNSDYDANPEQERHSWKISILCMNPGVAFEKVHNAAWTVLVASGTLSPIESLKTELGCTFAGTFQGAHVINRERVFGSIVSTGPTGATLNCSYKESLSLIFQDEVGRIVRDVCVSVPNGVLVFFPSYDRMENLYQRWMTKGIMRDIQASKKLFREERKLTVDEFENRLTQYNTQASKETKGAVLFAVFRGKVSEGIDFADKAARAVITIGIPYPNIKEVTIGLKKDYNDLARKTKQHLMSGHDWYGSQAFRALNQALGRCIRHKDDWGAILMIDSRLGMDYNQKNISRWLRESLCVTKDYGTLYGCLKEFVNIRKIEESQTNDENINQNVKRKLSDEELEPKETKRVIQPIMRPKSKRNDIIDLSDEEIIEIS